MREFIQALEAVRRCLSQAVVSHGKDGVEVTEAFGFVILGLVHWFLDTRCWMLDTEIGARFWVLVFFIPVYRFKSLNEYLIF